MVRKPDHQKKSNSLAGARKLGLAREEVRFTAERGWCLELFAGLLVISTRYGERSSQGSFVGSHPGEETSKIDDASRELHGTTCMHLQLGVVNKPGLQPVKSICSVSIQRSSC